MKKIVEGKKRSKYYNGREGGKGRFIGSVGQGGGREAGEQGRDKGEHENDNVAE